MILNIGSHRKHWYEIEWNLKDSETKHVDKEEHSTRNQGNIGIEWNATMMGIKGDIISDKNSIGDGNQRNL